MRNSYTLPNKNVGKKFFLMSFSFLLLSLTPLQAAPNVGKIWINVLQSGLGVSTTTSFHTGNSNTFAASMPLCSENMGFPCISKFSVRKAGSKIWTLMNATKKVDAVKRCTFCKYMNWQSIAEKEFPAGADSYYWSAYGFEKVTLSASLSGYFTGDPKNFGTANGMAYQVAGLGIEILDSAGNAPDNEYQVHLKLGPFSKLISGWFIGRLTDPTLDLTSNGDLIVSGGSVLLQSAGGEIQYGDLPTEYVSDLANECIPLSRCGLLSDPRSWNKDTPWQSFGYDGNDERTMKIFSQFEGIFGEKAQEQYRVWAVSNYRDGRKPVSNFGNCSAPGGFQGLVSTNATVFSSDPPVVTSDGISYQVGSTHLKADGGLNRGTYAVSLRKDLARCLWGEKFSPEFIGMELTYKDGTAEIVSTSINSTENFYNLVANGFHYSMPKLTLKKFKSAVKPSNVSVPESTPNISQPTQVPGTKKATISCIKGKVIKKVTATNPKCPAGYKKK